MSAVAQRITLTCQIDEDATTDESIFVPVSEAGTWLVEKMYYVNDDALAANDTNFVDISVENGGTEIASEQVTTADLGSLVAGTPVELVITGTGTDLEVAQGGALEFIKTKTGTGQALTGTFSVTLVKLQV